MPYKTCEHCGANMCYPKGGTPQCICKKQAPVATVRNVEAEIVGKQVNGDTTGNSLSGLRKGAVRGRAARKRRDLENVPKVQDEKEDTI